MKTIDEYKKICKDLSGRTSYSHCPTLGPALTLMLRQKLIDIKLLEQELLRTTFRELIAKGEYVVKLTHDDDGVEKMWVIVDGNTVAEFMHSIYLKKNRIVYIPDLIDASSESNKFWQVTSTTPTMADGVVKTLATLRSIQDESVVLELFEESTKFFTLVTPGPVKECLFCGHILNPDTSLCVDGKHVLCILQEHRLDCSVLPDDHDDDMFHL